MAKTLLRIAAASQSPSAAHAKIVFPLGWRRGVSAVKGPAGSTPVSSRNSRLPAASDQMKLVEQLWPIRLWLDRQRWRGPGWFRRVEGFPFDWARLRAMLPQGRVVGGDALVRELGQRLAPWIDMDDHQLLEDAGVGRYRLRAIEQLNSVRGAFQNRPS